MNALWKVIHLYGALRLFMTTYCTGFCLMESGAIASGLGYNGLAEDGSPKFDRIKSVMLWNLETSYKVKDFLANWNISAHKWL